MLPPIREYILARARVAMVPLIRNRIYICPIPLLPAGRLQLFDLWIPIGSLGSAARVVVGLYTVRSSLWVCYAGKLTMDSLVVFVAWLA